MSTPQAVVLTEEFWTMLFLGASMAISPIVGHWLLSKYPAMTVYLFAACLPGISAGTYHSGLGVVHLFYTPLLMLASWQMCVFVVALLDAVRCFVASCVSSACRGLGRTLRNTSHAIYRAVVESPSLLLAFRTLSVAFVAAATLAFPPLVVPIILGLALWLVYQVVLALEYLVQRVIALACVACEAVNEAATQALYAVKSVVFAAVASMLSWARSIVATLFWGAMSLLLATLTVLLRMLAFSLKFASIVNFLVDPCAETFVVALSIKVVFAVMKYMAESSRR